MFDRKYRITVFVSAIFFIISFSNHKDAWGNTYSPNVHWVFCIDTSGSMKAKGHMDLLKLITEKISSEFIAGDNNIIKAGDRITIFSFDQEVRLEVTSLYQTENDIIPIRDTLEKINRRNGSLTFISEAIVQAMALTNKYSQFFHTSALYVFTDGKSEPYSPKWSPEKIAARKKRDAENFNKVSLFKKDHGLNVWVGVLKWEAFDDAKYLVKKMGRGGHLVDLTDFNRLSLEKALMDFSDTVRSSVKIAHADEIDFGTIPYQSIIPYRKAISLRLQTDKIDGPPGIMGRIHFDPDNPSDMPKTYPVNIQTTEDKMVLNFVVAESKQLRPGTYKGKLTLLPSQSRYGELDIEPSEFNVEFRKSGFLSFYVWRGLVVSLSGFLFLSYLFTTIKRKMPIKI